MRRSRIGYLLEDTFGDADRGAGAVNGTDASRKGGPRTVTDVDGDALSVSDGEFVLANPNLNWGDQKLVYGPYIRTAGLVTLASWRQDGDEKYWTFAVDDASPWTATAEGFYLDTFGAIRFRNGTINVLLANFVKNVVYTGACVLRSTGMYLFIKGGSFITWTLLWIDSTSSTGNPYVGINQYDAVGAFQYFRIPNLLWLPHPICADTFTRADGALGNSEHRGPDNQKCGVRTWTGPTWDIVSNESRNQPTESGELVTDTSFDTACGVNWACGVGWNIAAGVATHVPGVASTIQEIAIVSTDEWHMCQFDITARTAGEVRGRVGGTNGTLVSAVATHLQVIRSGVLTNAGCFSNAAFDGSIDNISIKQLTLSSLFSSLSTSTADTIIRCQVATLIDDTQCGLVARLDDAGTPTNFIHMHFDGAGNVVLDEMVAGVYQATIMSVAQAFTADDWLILILDGLTYRAYHETNAGVATLLGSGNVTVDGSAGTLAGMFSTYDGNRINAVEFWARGTQNEYRRLDVF